jgi:hypothetical protein
MTTLRESHLRTVFRSMPSDADSCTCQRPATPFRPPADGCGANPLLPGPHRADTPPRKRNYVTAWMGNYVTDNPSTWGNQVTADS